MAITPQNLGQEKYKTPFVRFSETIVSFLDNKCFLIFKEGFISYVK